MVLKWKRRREVGFEILDCSAVRVLIEDGMLRGLVVLLLFVWAGCGTAKALGNSEQELVFQARSCLWQRELCGVWLDVGVAMLRERDQSGSGQQRSRKVAVASWSCVLLQQGVERTKSCARDFNATSSSCGLQLRCVHSKMSHAEKGVNIKT